MGDFSFYMVIPAAAAIELGTIVERYRDRCRHCDVDVDIEEIRLLDSVSAHVDKLCAWHRAGCHAAA